MSNAGYSMIIIDIYFQVTTAWDSDMSQAMKSSQFVEEEIAQGCQSRQARKKRAGEES